MRSLELEINLATPSSKGSHSKLLIPYFKLKFFIFHFKFKAWFSSKIFMRSSNCAY